MSTSESKVPSIYYFGCWSSVGHHLFTSYGQMIPTRILPFAIAKDIDYGFCPKPTRDETQGHGALHLIDGWTVLSFFDRSIDRRYGSHSTFVAEGSVSFESMKAMCRDYFPGIWGRFTFEVILR